MKKPIRKSAKRKSSPSAAKNLQLAAQRRKVLGSHYAAKYRVGKR